MILKYVPCVCCVRSKDITHLFEHQNAKMKSLVVDPRKKNDEILRL